MKILLVTATHKEIEAIPETLENYKCLQEDFFRGFMGDRLIDILVTGVGSIATAEKLALVVNSSKYDLVVNAGICGSFNKNFSIGCAVNITSEIWGDIGAEDHEDFLDLFDLGISKSGEKPFSGKMLVNEGNSYSVYFAHLPRVKGLTVNTVHGKNESIEQCKRKYNPDVESMEGAVVFSLCISRGINFQCIRTISNFVEPRNRPAWNIDNALTNLTKELIQILSVIR